MKKSVCIKKCNIACACCRIPEKDRSDTAAGVVRRQYTVYVFPIFLLYLGEHGNDILFRPAFLLFGCSRSGRSGGNGWCRCDILMSAAGYTQNTNRCQKEDQAFLHRKTSNISFCGVWEMCFFRQKKRRARKGGSALRPLACCYFIMIGIDSKNGCPGFVLRGSQCYAVFKMP